MHIGVSSEVYREIQRQAKISDFPERHGCQLISQVFPESSRISADSSAIMMEIVSF